MCLNSNEKKMDSELIPWPVQLIKACSDGRLSLKPALTAGPISLNHTDLIERVFQLTRILESEYEFERGTRVITAYPDTAEGWIGFCLLQISLGQLGVCFTVLDTRSKSLTDKARSHVISVFRPDFYIPISGIVVVHELLPSSLILDWSLLVSGPIPVCKDIDFSCDVDLDDGAFVDWTSGSTGGMPKGCITTHRTLSKMYIQKWHGFLSHASPSVVGCNLFFLWYWWQPLCGVSSTVILLDSELRDVNLFNQCIELNRITVLDCITPSLLKVLCDTQSCLSTCVSHVLVSGEGFPMTLVSQCMKTFSECRFFNVFSTTETGDCAMVEISPQLLNMNLTMCPIGRPLFGVELIVSEGELIVSGTGAKEYIGDAAATAKGFSTRGWMSKDKVSDCGDGLLVIEGRLDDCVKLRGFKIDLKSIETETERICPECTAVAIPTGDRIFLFVTNLIISQSELMRQLKTCLPDSHVPHRIIVYSSPFPLTRTGKLDKKEMLRLSDTPKTLHDHIGDQNDLMERILNVFRKFPLGQVDDEIESSFWERGGTSLMAMSLCAQLGVPVKVLMDSPVGSPREIFVYLSLQTGVVPAVVQAPESSAKVAVIGMSGRWPGIDGSTTSLKIKEFLQIREKNSSFGMLNEELIGFDCEYWKIPKPSAVKLDPHQRIFLEMASEALVDAGYFDRGVSLACGVYAAGGSLSHYLEMLGQNLDEIRQLDPGKYLELELGCDKDYIALRTAKLLDLTGPAMTVQAACASGLVAVAQAATAIRAGECSLAIAGGVSLALTANGQAGHVKGLIWSQDGLCRPFDDNATGTVNGNAGQVFLLKNYDLALRDGDTMYGVITGGAVVNDGARRGKDFVAPSVSGHVEAIQKALNQAGRSPAEISMIEAHGTGTLMGDPMEYSALIEGYRSNNTSPLCIGSVKGNIGHANTAAGALGLGKVLTSLFYKTLFPSGSFKTLNRNIKPHPGVRIQEEFEHWIGDTLIAGISSLGMGGTNCHLIVEHANTNTADVDDTLSLLACSGHSMKSIKKIWDEIQKIDNLDIKVSSTLYHYRNHERSKFRKVGLPESVDTDPIECIPNGKRIVLLFPGQGGDWPLGFESDQEIVDWLGYDPVGSEPSQLALFCIQFTVGKAVLTATPDALEIVVCGHSIGEYAAAVLAGSLCLGDALRIVQRREMLLKPVGGKMAVVVATAEEVINALKKFDNVELACYNRVDRITISGNSDQIDLFVEKSGFKCKILNTSGAFHSASVDSVVAELAEMKLDSNSIMLKPYHRNVKWLSTLSGAFMDLAPTDMNHWSVHTRKPVLFTQCIDLVSKCAGTLFIDAGKMLGPLVGKSERVLSLNSDFKHVRARLWEFGFNVDLLVPKLPRVLGLPTIGWDRTVCWPVAQQRIESSQTRVKEIAFEEVWVPFTLVPQRESQFLTVDDDIAEMTRLAFEEGVAVILKLKDSDENVAKFSLKLIQSFIKAREEIDRLINVSLTFIAGQQNCSVLLGIIRCAQSEHPDLGIALVRSDGNIVKWAYEGNNEYRIDSNGEISVRRIEKVSNFALLPLHHFQLNGEYLVTGGLGGIGVELVNWLLQTWEAKRVVIVARKLVHVSDFGWLSDKVEIHPKSDFHDTPDDRGLALVDWTCVFHLAGQVVDGLVANIDMSDFMEISSGKILGAKWLLRNIRVNCPIVFFSSTSGLLGSPGQALYAAANTVLDELATTRNNTISIQWGGWAASVKNSMSDRFGLVPLEDCERYLSISDGFDAMLRVLGTKKKNVAIADIYDWRKYTEKAHLNRSLVCLLNGVSQCLVSEELVRMGKQSWLGDHRDASGPLVPATALVGAMLDECIESVTFSEPLRLDRFVKIDRLGDKILLQSSPHGEASWTAHAGATVGRGPSRLHGMIKAIAKEDTWTEKSVDDLYKALTKGGFEYGPSFRRVKKIHVCGSFVIARIDGSEMSGFEKSDISVYYNNAAVLDACTHIASALDERASWSFPSSARRVTREMTDEKAARKVLSSIVGIAEANSSWYSIMRLSPLVVGPDFSNRVCVDLIALGPSECISFEELELTPIEPEEKIIVLQNTNDVLEISKPMMKPVSIEGGFYSVEICGPMKTKRVSLVVASEGTHVKTEAWGLSFLDVLAAKGVMSKNMFGGEFSGTVEFDSTLFKKGDRVMGISQGGFSSHLRTNFIVRIPDQVSFLEAATLPVSFCTALFALSRAGHALNGAVVLVHNATGALGMALLRVIETKYPTCKIVGTCSQGKKLNLEKVLDSRNAENWSFPHKSVDVSIGAMHPDLLVAVIPLMKSFGVIVDVGKRLQVENTLLGLGPFSRGLTYTTAHLDELMRVDRDQVAALLAEAATFEALPFKKYSVGKIDEGLEFLASGQHVGKVVVEMHYENALKVEGSAKDIELRRIWGRSVEVKKMNFNALHIIESMTVYESADLSEESILRSLSLVAPLGSESTALILVNESWLMGRDAVPSAFRGVRKQLLAAWEEGDKDEQSWVENAVAKLLAKPFLSPKDLELSLEELGIDSLGRLQLWHNFRRQFPHSKSSHMSSTISLGRIFGTRTVTNGDKWLALHGFRTNPAVIEHQLGALIAKLLPDAQFVYPAAPHEAKGPCPIEGQGFEWWSSDKQGTAYETGWIGSNGLGESLEVMRNLCEKHSFAGVIGFSQGAGIAHELVASGKIPKGILFSPVAPVRDSWPIDIAIDCSKSVVIVQDNNDSSVQSYPKTGLTVIQHQEGHNIPDMDQKMIEMIRNSIFDH